MASKIVTVVGATGNQGAGVVDALLKNPNYRVRATTRRPSSEAANALRARGVEVLQVDLNDAESLKTAFAGSHYVFAVTDFFEPFSKSGPEHAMKVETEQGINLARAAAETATLEHYIWSSLPNSRSLSNGKYVVPHFDGKNRVDDYIRSNKNLLAKTTILWVTWYHTNYNFPMFTPYFIPTAGKYVQFATHAPSTPISTIGNVRENVGPFVEAILANPRKVSNGAIVKADIEDTTSGKLLQTWARAAGKEAITVNTDVPTYNALWPMWAEEMGVMMRFWDEFKEKSWTELGQTVLTRESLGIDPKSFTSLESALETLNF
jgi:uncharacterized protein YbjT (DUF2867 family)